MAKKIIFTGCSLTDGYGWVDRKSNNLHYEDNVKACKECPELWVNLCHNQILQLNKLELFNYGIAGISNTEIFEHTITAIVNFNFDIDTLFCQWTGMPRVGFHVGFELWNTELRFPGKNNDITLSNGSHWDKKYLDELINRIAVLHHLHAEIVKLVKYCNILQALASRFNIKLYFINGLCPWDQNYFIRLSNVTPEEFTTFTKKDILEINSRNSENIFKLYKKMHNDYDNAGGINPSQWVNLYNSMQNNKIDTNYDNKHPGTKSNRLYFQQIKDFLDNQ